MNSEDRKTVFFFCFSKWGHVMPMRPLMQELVRRGFRVRVFSNEEFRGVVSETGAELVATDRFEAGTKPQMPEGFPQIETPDSLLAVAVRGERSLAAEIEQYEPVLTVVDSLCYWGKLIVRKYDLPAVVSSPTIPINLFTLGDYLREYFRMMEPGIDYIQTCLDRLSAERGFPKQTFLSLLLLEQNTDCIFYQTREFLPCPETFGPNQIFFAGACGRSRNQDRESFARPAGVPEKKKRPLIFVTMGTISSSGQDFWRQCVQAFTGRNVDVILALWRYLKQESIGPLPDNITVLREADLEAYLPHADVMLCHGGLNTISAALWEGVPVVICPGFSDQFANARLTEALGAGLRLQDSRAETIWDAVCRVLTEASYRTQARQLGRSMRQSGTEADAVDWMLQRQGKGVAQSSISGICSEEK